MKKKKETLRVMKKDYNKFLVFLCNESMFEYSLLEWEMVISEDWLDVEKLDKTEMDSFAIQNIVRVRFVNTDKKEKSTLATVSKIKPVPPTVV
jgi:hypothetical protein